MGHDEPGCQEGASANPRGATNRYEGGGSGAGAQGVGHQAESVTARRGWPHRGRRCYRSYEAQHTRTLVPPRGMTSECGGDGLEAGAQGVGHQIRSEVTALRG
jgi:hypothetical protein